MCTHSNKGVNVSKRTIQNEWIPYSIKPQTVLITWPKTFWGICSYLTSTVHEVGKVLNKKDKKNCNKHSKLHLKEIPILPIATESKRKPTCVNIEKYKKKAFESFFCGGKRKHYGWILLTHVTHLFCICWTTTIWKDF